MIQRQCECCKEVKSKLFNASSYNSEFTYVCGSCLIRLAIAMSTSKDAGMNASADHKSFQNTYELSGMQAQ